MNPPTNPPQDPPAEAAKVASRPAPAGKELWRSLDELADTREFRNFVEKEFPNHAPELLAGSSRRHFLKVMGASFALAGMGGLTGCIRWPREKILLARRALSPDRPSTA